MTLSAHHRELVALYTGRSTFEDNGDLARALNAISAAAEALVLKVIADCEAVDATIKDYIPKLALAISDGAREVRGGYSLGVLQALGRSHSGRLCGFLSLSMGVYDPWASAYPVATAPPPT